MFPSDKIVEFEGCNGEVFNLTTGDRGVYLATDVEGAFYDPPVKVVYEEPGNFPGARYLNHRILRRDIVFGVEILNESRYGERSWISRDSEWRKAWAFDRDSFFHITTPESGKRTLKVRLGESMAVPMKYDPSTNEINRTGVVAIAGDPFWYGEDAVYEAVTTKDTRFKPGPFVGAWPWDKFPKETLTLHAHPDDEWGGLNPTDQYVWPKWGLPGATEKIPEFGWPFPPGVPIPWERAPFVQYKVPDYNFEDPEFANRRPKTPGLIIGEDCILDTDPLRETFTSASGSPVWSRTNGVEWLHPIPPWTPERKFEVDVAGSASGQMITLRVPRPWSRPWGME